MAQAPARQRVQPNKCVGEVESSGLSFSWIRPSKPLSHPEASKHGGKIYCNSKDVLGVPLSKGAKVEFFLYKDRSGLGAEECRKIGAVASTGPTPHPPARTPHPPAEAPKFATGQAAQASRSPAAAAGGPGFKAPVPKWAAKPNAPKASQPSAPKAAGKGTVTAPASSSSGEAAGKNASGKAWGKSVQKGGSAGVPPAGKVTIKPGSQFVKPGANKAVATPDKSGATKGGGGVGKGAIAPKADAPKIVPASARHQMNQQQGKGASGSKSQASQTKTAAPSDFRKSQTNQQQTSNIGGAWKGAGKPQNAQQQTSAGGSWKPQANQQQGGKAAKGQVAAGQAGAKGLTKGGAKGAPEVKKTIIKPMAGNAATKGGKPGASGGSRPTAPASKPPPRPMPPNWEEHMSEEHNVPYFWNRVTKESVWIRPVK